MNVSASLSHAAIKEKILKEELTIRDKKGRSKVWKIFGIIVDGNGTEMEGMVACKKCLNVYKNNVNCTSNLIRHKCYVAEIKEVRGPKIDINSEEKKRVVEICTQWAVRSCRSFRIVEDSGLAYLAEYLMYIGSKYGANVHVQKLLPNHTTISRNIGQLYSICKANIINEISHIKKNGFGLTSDIWTDNHVKRSYISLTIHYIKNGRLINRLLGLKSMEGERCTGMYILKTKIPCKKSNYLKINFKVRIDIYIF